MEAIGKYLSEIELEEASVYENLTMFGVSRSAEGSLVYMTLSDAIRLGAANVSEISDSGSVPELRFTNSADLPVLILDGEELIGAKQNRTVNLTVLAPPGKTITIPVSCVEAGRWSQLSSHFEMSDRNHFARGRAVKVASVSRSLQRAGTRRSDQRRVWADISDKASRMDAQSATEAMAGIFDRHRNTVENFVAAFEPRESQTGAIFAIGSEIVGLDLFDRRTTLAAMLPKLVRSYAIDAMDTTGATGGARMKDVESFLGMIAEAGVESYDAVGLGDDLRIVGPGLVGGGLMVDGDLVHLAAFAMNSEREGVDSRGLARAWVRRRSFGLN